jgi:hypothetical protein
VLDCDTAVVEAAVVDAAVVVAVDVSSLDEGAVPVPDPVLAAAPELDEPASAGESAHRREPPLSTHVGSRW